MTTTTYNVEVFQPRSPREFLGDDGDLPTDDDDLDMFHAVRDLRCGFVAPDDISFADFGRWYDLVGTEAIEADDAKQALGRTFQSWQNNDGITTTSDTFREMNDQRRAVSLSSGDIIRVDGTAYMCLPVGWGEVEAVSN